MFEISIQASIGTKVISKSVVKALRKMLLPNAMAVIFQEKKAS